MNGLDILNKHQQPTKAICNKVFSENSSILPRIKFRVGGQDSSPQSLTAHSPAPLPPSVKRVATI